MDNIELLKTLAKEYEGDLLNLCDDKRLVNVKYTSGSLPIFSKLEILVVPNKDSLFSKDSDFQLFVLRNFHPIISLILESGDISEETIEEVRQQVTDGIFSFVRLKKGYAELLTVAVSNPKKRGVYYYPTPESRAVPLIEIPEEGEENFTIHLENIEVIPEI
ncbi:hypothetical protein [Desulfurobacterium crinifex]|jgi:hypothetical protein